MKSTQKNKKQRVKEYSWSFKEPVIRKKIFPYFGKRKIEEIEAKDVIAWQNELLAFRYPSGKAYSQNYLETITPTDFNFERSELTINKSYQRLKGKDVITSPKTIKSNGTIKMSKFLCDEMKEYMGMIYGLKDTDRIFPLTKSYMHHEMDRGAKEVAGKCFLKFHKNEVLL